MIHELKILPSFYEDVIQHRKTFEVRKNDRPYAVGDFLILHEYTPDKGYSGRAVEVPVIYILNDIRYCKPDFIIMGLGFPKTPTFNLVHL